jgi:hypothetical protein
MYARDGKLVARGLRAAWFCKWMLQNFCERLDQHLLFITDEAYFHLSGYVIPIIFCRLYFVT